MALAIFPLTIVGPAIRPLEDPLTVLHILEESTFIGASISVEEFPLAMHSVPLPLTGVRSSVRPIVGSNSAHVVGLEGADVPRTVRPREEAFTMFHPLEVVALKAASIWPHLDSCSVVLIQGELARVLRAIDIHSHSIAVLHVVEKVTLVPVSSSMLEATHSLCLVLHPLPGVGGSIWPSLYSVAFARDTYPLAFIDRAIGELVCRAHFALALMVRGSCEKSPTGFCVSHDLQKAQC
mmetsp:Transcript_59982/g.140133  ORF Transcript_59982/g.140133 Transcript_59982/m.140133 type:complete len:237 (+) Transcript_59982:213-923(+)